MPDETTTTNMKTKLKIAAFAAIVTAGCIAGISKSHTSEASAITLVNVEALTYDEWGYDHGCVSNGDGCILRYNQWYPDALPKDM